MVDSGDLFSPPGYNIHSFPEKDKKLTALKVDLFIQAYNLMKYDAFTPGEIDLSLGIAELRKISKKAKFAFLLTNLRDRQRKTSVFQPYLIKEIGDLRVGFLGLISPRWIANLPPAEKEIFEIAEPLEVTAKVIKELSKKKCQVIIAIAHMEEGEQRQLAENFREIYFVVGGHVRTLKRQPLEIRNAQIINAGARGEYLGQMEFFLKQRPGEKRLFSHYQVIPLTDSYADHPQIAELVNQFLASSKKLYQRESKSISPEKGSGMPNRPYTLPISNFMGDQFCFLCHQRQHESWKKTGHARAYKALMRLKRERDYTCLPCHTTGFGEISGFDGVLENVQCEACHGPRRGHPDDRKKGPALSEKQCLSCHNQAKSPNFDYVTYLAKVRCPGLALASDSGKSP